MLGRADRPVRSVRAPARHRSRREADPGRSRRRRVGRQQVACCLTSIAAHPAQAHVARDGGEPASTAGRVMQLMGIVPGFDQRFLRQIFSGVGVACQACAQPYQARPFGRHGSFPTFVRVQYWSRHHSPQNRRSQVNSGCYCIYRRFCCKRSREFSRILRSCRQFLQGFIQRYANVDYRVAILGDRWLLTCCGYRGRRHPSSGPMT